MILRARLRLAYIDLARRWVDAVSSQAREHRTWLFQRMVEAKRLADRAERREEWLRGYDGNPEAGWLRRDA